MKTAIIIHGWDNRDEFFDMTRPSPSNTHWIPWLQKQLSVKGITTQTPEMPDSYEPNYEKWKSVFELFPLDQETILIGHSCGGGFLVRWLSEHEVKVGQVILVAPWLDPTRELGAENDFFRFNINSNLSERSAHGITMLYSTDDDIVILQSVETIQVVVAGIHIKQFSDKGHFILGDMGTNEFPELLEEIVI